MSILYFIRGKLNFPLTKRIVICEICSSQTKELLPGLRLNLDVFVLLNTQLLKRRTFKILASLKANERSQKNNFYVFYFIRGHIAKSWDLVREKKEKYVMVLVLVIIILFPNIISVVFSILQLHNKIIFLFSLDILLLLLLYTLLCHINL